MASGTFRYCFSIAIKLTTDILPPHFEKKYYYDYLLVQFINNANLPQYIEEKKKSLDSYLFHNTIEDKKKCRFLPHNLERLGSLQKYKKYAQAQI